MSMPRLHLPLAAALMLLGAATSAQAGLVTVVGTNFDVVYDDTQLGLFSAPIIVGDSLYFTFNTFRAESLNGAGAVSTNDTISGLVLKAKGNYSFGAFNLAEFGDYTLSGAGSLVRVQGQLRAFNVANSIFTQTNANLLVAPSTPLNINDGANHDWTASARIDANTAPTPVSFGLVTNVILSNPRDVGLAIENRLTAYTDANGTGFRQAFIEKKFNGIQLDVLAPVPLPSSVALLASGLGALAYLMRRRIE